MAERIARDLIVHGRVQGVFYRAFVGAAAERHGVAGRAVNRDDGTVAVHLEGDAVGSVARRSEGVPVVHLHAVGPGQVDQGGVELEAGHDGGELALALREGEFDHAARG